MCTCATCGNVKIVIWWAQVCVAHVTYLLKLADRGPQSQGTTSHTSAAATTRNNITQYVTDLLTPVQNEDTAAEFWQQKIATNSQSAVPLIAQDMISAPTSQAFVERLFSFLLTVGRRRNRMEKSLSTMMNCRTCCRL